MKFLHKATENFVSVLLPVKNGEEHLTGAIESLLLQTFENFEIIAVDHNSKDATLRILKEYAKKDERVKVHSYSSNGFVDCLNYGLSHCKGEFVARMDADDTCHKERLALQTAYLVANSEIGIVGSRVKMTGNIQEGYRRYEEWINSVVTRKQIETEIFVESPLPHPSVMARREVLERLGGYRDFDGPEDYDLWLRAYFAGIGMAKVDKVLLEWRDRPERLSRKSKRYSRKNFHKLRAFYLAKFLNGREVVIQGAGTTGRWIGKFLRANGANLKAYLDINPRKVGGTKLGLPVYSAERMGDLGDLFLLAAVSSWGARELIRKEAAKAGFTEGVDFLCAS